ncbi:LMBR1-like membrane protein-domain-containing protein [Hyaloraphidium curvatum]|nr:LMBR1-like membrane protein-domain-containing protein [Hyaloraphidium curvatum]
MLWPVLLAALATGVVVAALVHRYGNVRRHRWYVTATTYVGWLGPFCIVFLLPIDLTSTLYRRRCSEGGDCPAPPLVLVSESFLYAFWTAIYWTSFVLTWAVIPTMTSYVRSGRFSAVDKIKEAVRANLIYYAVAGALGVAFIVYIAVAKGLTGQALLSFLIAMANGWGLLLIVLFLGHGLVSVPRELWRRADYHLYLKHLQYLAPGMKEAANDAEIEFYDVANDVAAAARRVGDADPLRPFVDRLLEKCPMALTDRNLGQASSLPASGVTSAHLVQLHLRLKAAVRAKERREAQWSNLLREAFFFEDLVESERNPEKKLVTAVTRSGTVPGWRMSLDWWWYLRIRPALQRALASCCALLSAALIWSEMTFQIQKPMLTILGLLFHIPGISYEWIEAMCIITVSYMCICAYSSLFKVRIFDVYALVPNHHTDEGSLLFVAAYLCRLTFPLCYNFLNLLTDQEDTMFVAIMGKIDLLPLLGSFQVYVPLSIGLICLATFFHFHSRLLAMCGWTDFFTGEDRADGPIVQEGKSYIDQARAAEERQRRNNSPANGSVGYARDRDTDRLLQDAEERRSPTVSERGLGNGRTIRNGRGSANPEESRQSLSARLQGLFAPKPTRAAAAPALVEVPAEFEVPELEDDNIESILASRQAKAPPRTFTVAD